MIIILMKKVKKKLMKMKINNIKQCSWENLNNRFLI